MGTYRGFKISKATTNLVPLSRTSKTKTITVVSGTIYTASVRGKAGSVVLSGAGTGTVIDGTPVTFTATTNSLTLTVTGYLKHMQVEPGSIATREVWTRNSPVTKPNDAPAPITGLQTGLKLGSTDGAIIIDFRKLISDVVSSPYLDLIKQSDTVTNNSIRLVTNTVGTGQLKIRIYFNGVLTERDLSSINLLNGGKIGLSWSSSQLKVFYNGTLVDTVTQSIPTSLDSLVFTATGNEVIYKGIYMFKTRPLDTNMVVATNY